MRPALAVALVVAVLAAGCTMPYPPRGGDDAEPRNEWARAVEVSALSAWALAARPDGGADVLALKLPNTARLARYDANGTLVSHRWENVTEVAAWNFGAPAGVARASDGGLLALAMARDAIGNTTLVALRFGSDGAFSRAFTARIEGALPADHFFYGPSILAPRGDGRFLALASTANALRDGVEPRVDIVVLDPDTGFEGEPRSTFAGAALAARVDDAGRAHVVTWDAGGVRHVHLAASGRPEPQSVDETTIPGGPFHPAALHDANGTAYVISVLDGLVGLDAAGPRGARSIPVPLEGAESVALGLGAGPAVAASRANGSVELVALDDAGRVTGHRAHPGLAGARVLALAPAEDGAWYALLLAESRRLPREDPDTEGPLVEELVVLRLVPDAP